jgi:hypothetical protein
VDEDDALERFIERFLAFISQIWSKIFLNRLNGRSMCPLTKFMFRTLKSNSVSGSVKTRRLALCFDVANELRSDVIELMLESLIYAELGRTMAR